MLSAMIASIYKKTAAMKWVYFARNMTKTMESARNAILGSHWRKEAVIVSDFV